MRPQQPAPDDSFKGNNDNAPKKRSNKFLSGLKKVGFKVWLALMIIGGVLAFITALFLV